MPCKLRYSLAALAAIVIVAICTSGFAGPRSTNAGALGNRPVLNQSNQPKSYIGRNDGYVQQIPSYGSTKGLATKQGSKPVTQLPTSYNVKLPRRVD